MTTNIENIVDAKGMVETRQQLHAEIDTSISEIWRHCRAELDGKNLWRPYFPRSPEVDGIIAKIDTADHTLATLASDTAELAEAMGDFKSIAELARAMNAASSAVTRAEHNVRTIMSGLIKRGVTLEDVGEDPAVIEAQLALDRVISEHKPLAEDLTARIAKAKAILERYS